jgi:hypothetical protein
LSASSASAAAIAFATSDGGLGDPSPAARLGVARPGSHVARRPGRST